MTALVSDGVTIIASASGAVTTLANDAAQQQGSCASGWYGCPASVGGNCCPSNFQCGTASCSLAAAASVTGSINEVSKQSVGSRDFTNLLGILFPVLGGILMTA